MGWELVGQGALISLPDLPQYESQLAEGSSNLLELDLRLPVPAGVAQTLEDELVDAGVEGVRVRTASPMLKIFFNKGFPWLAVIVAIVLASLVIAALVIAWRLFTYIGAVSPESIPFLILGGIAVLTIAGVYLVRRRV